MVAGFEGGYVYIVTTDGLQDMHVARNTSARITSVACSSTGDQVGRMGVWLGMRLDGLQDMHMTCNMLNS